MAPEVVSNKPYGVKSDMWSVGCILYEFITLSPPNFQMRSLQEVELFFQICPLARSSCEVDLTT
jgi:NIMA (never in mitosis gene a)-related kinase